MIAPGCSAGESRRVAVNLFCCGASFDAFGTPAGIATVTCGFCGGFLVEVAGRDPMSSPDETVAFNPEVHVVSLPWQVAQ